MFTYFYEYIEKILDPQYGIELLMCPQYYSRVSSCSLRELGKNSYYENICHDNFPFVFQDKEPRLISIFPAHVSFLYENLKAD